MLQIVLLPVSLVNMAIAPTDASAQSFLQTAQNSPMADFGYMADHPALATALGHDIGKETGVDTTKPENLAAVMHSQTYAKKVNDMKTGIDDRLVKRVIGSVPTAINPKANGSQQEMDVYTGQEQNAVGQIRAGAVLAGKKIEAQKKLGELSDFDAESYKASRIKEINPTGDVDQKILELRMQAMTAKSALRNELRQLAPNLRDQAINARMAVFNDAISTLGEIRTARTAAANAKIDEEIGAKNQQVRTAKANVDALDGIIATLEKQGDQSDAIYKIRLERAKAQKILDKAGGSGIPNQEETIVNYLLNDLTKRGHTPTASDIANAKRIAKETVDKRKQSAGGIRTAQGGANKGVMSSLSLASDNPIRLPSESGETQEDIYAADE